MTDRHPSQQRTEEEHARRNGYSHGIERRSTSPSWLARAAGVVLSGLSVGFVGLFIFVLETGGDLTLVTRPLPMQVALALPTVIAVLTAATTCGTALAWWHSYWSLRVRLHQTVLSVLGLGFSWQLATVGFLSL
ncbi:hypothetical protein SAMN04488063_0047 [Halopelagius inordinatus]|uniref:Uncharacterized protein n=1 Tax=Halopelagius inordinatus TaxID=553467 RepID=A0A1I2WXS6_9EURY|nr:hypothetical protein [Halopelagius inordinatus]SFH06098.1 hypothetical protein SAMN04488063_0047 [Halopelagius inordinatus]